MKMAAHQPNFIPWLPYFDKAKKADVLILLDDVQFPKGDYVNRVKIRTSNGWEWLTIPVKTESKDMKIKDALIADEHNWRDKALKTLRQNYQRTPFWRIYEKKIEELLAQDTDELTVFNMTWLSWLFDELQIDTKIVLQSDLPGINAKATELVAQLTMAVNCDLYLSGRGAKGYMKHEVFEKLNLAVKYQEFKHPVYKQVYEPFIYGLSVLDALLNIGPNLRFLID